ncbi:hypothetical protein NEFER03_0647 [Nematocida sp. LUAm3]|nr:hypothetical protein NEFER03_0647 [Nematocida sp. LUAm3]KAI5176398.1 hypothetical protein NEFER02_2169 [Nematocida sp. LUAm2]KAI5179313.1 hypothetical protein NEFER01_2161 [Nematocida sp. LUAm1]
MDVLSMYRGVMGGMVMGYIGGLVLSVTMRKWINEVFASFITGIAMASLLLIASPLVYREGRCTKILPYYLFHHLRVHLLGLAILIGMPSGVARERWFLLLLGWITLKAVLQTIYNYTRKSMFKSLNTGHNLEVLQLEKYLLNGVGELPSYKLDTEISLESFYRRGSPKALPLLQIFKAWCRKEKTEGNVYEEYGYDLGESLRVPNRPRLTPVMENVEGAISVASLLESFEPFHANALFSLISYGERARIRYSTFTETFRQISIERNNLFYAIKDHRRLLNQFHRFLTLIEGILLFMTFTITMGMKNLFLHSFLSFALVHAVIPGSVSFIESFIFLLVSHPYDNGDRVLIQGSNMLVKRVGLFATVFCTWSGEYVIIQNNVVSKLPIVNIRRSISQYWLLEIPISFECSNASILKLKKRLQWYVQEEKMLTGLIFAPDTLDQGNAVKIRLLIRKNSNFQNGFFTLTNYTKCLACIIRILNEENLYYKPPIARHRVSDKYIDEIARETGMFPTAYPKSKVSS